MSGWFSFIRAIVLTGVALWFIIAPLGSLLREPGPRSITIDLMNKKIAGIDGRILVFITGLGLLYFTEKTFLRFNKVYKEGGFSKAIQRLSPSYPQQLSGEVVIRLPTGEFKKAESFTFPIAFSRTPMVFLQHIRGESFLETRPEKVSTTGFEITITKHEPFEGGEVSLLWSATERF